MKEEILKILNKNGYHLTDEASYFDLVEIMEVHKKIVSMLEEAKICFPKKAKRIKKPV